MTSEEQFYEALSLEDFTLSGWEDAFLDNQTNQLEMVSLALEEKGRKAGEEGNVSQRKALCLLADVCSMVLQPNSINEPYKCYSCQSERVTHPDDLKKSDLDWFATILPAITYPQLKARIADLLWFKNRSKLEFALEAIDSYIRTPITLDSFLNDGGQHWARGIQLARLLKHAAAEKMKNIKETLLKAIWNSTESDGFLVKWLVDGLVGKFGVGVGFEVEIAEKLTSLGNAFKLQNNFQFAQEYYRTSSEWFLKADRGIESSKALATCAQIWHSEACLKERSENFIGASDSLEKSIQIYLAIPKKHRASLGIEESALQQLKSHHRDLGQLASESMMPISSSTIDITEMRDTARAFVFGHPIQIAFRKFISLYPGANEKKIRMQAKKTLTEFNLGTFFGITKRSKDGRIVAKNPGISSVEKDSKEYEHEVWAEMLRSYCFEIGTVAAGSILPALETMVAEHRMTEDDFVVICSQSSIVPPNRRRAFAKSLFSGYDLDLDTFIHRVVPQIENMVRYHLRGVGAVTTNPDKNGIEMEVNLSALLDKPAASQVFGENLVFEMKALFCEQRGPNFRHQLAHGLLEEDDTETLYAVYVWYFTLRIVLSPFWKAHKK